MDASRVHERMENELSAISDRELELVWGAEAISALIGRTSRATFHMLEKGELPARKVGGRWVIERNKLIAHFTEDAA